MSMVLLAICSTYIALFTGLFLGRVSSEELSKGSAFIKILRKSIVSISVLFFSNLFLEPLFSVIGTILSILISFVFWKINFSRQLLVFFWPLALYAIKDSSWFIFVLGSFVLYLLIVGSELVIPYVDKKDPYTITISILELMKKGIKETNLILISFVICFILSFL